MKYIIKSLILLLIFAAFINAQERKPNPPPMMMNIGNFDLSMNRLMGDGGLQSQFSWNLAGDNRQNTFLFHWPQDRWMSNMLYQIFNPISLDDNGIIDENGVNHPMFTRGDALTNFGVNDWAYEVRRYRPPHVIVDGIQLDAPYQWYVDPNLEADEKIVFEDVLPQFGIRSHVELLSFSNPEHGDYVIWKATHKFTGEIKIPRNASSSKDTLVDQTIKFWWPISFSFGPSKEGERYVYNNYNFESEDDLDSWMVRKSDLGGSTDSLYIAYYWDSKNPNVQAFTNGSKDDTGDPDRQSGFLHSVQVPGYALLHADKSYIDKTNDLDQPYAMPHAGITKDLWGRRDIGLRQTYRGDDSRGRFPLDATTLGQTIDKGPMRFITVGPYELTKAPGRQDSITLVYAVGVGGMDYQQASSIGSAWLNNQITDQQKKDTILNIGRERLASTLDKANWSYNQILLGNKIPTAPPPPDINVASGPDKIIVSWEYPDLTYFKDFATGTDDWAGWKVYRKQGALLVNDPTDLGTEKQWELVYETNDRNVTEYVDANITRGIDYYYAVTAIDNGTLNNNRPLESSRFLTRSLLPAVSFKPGLSTSSEVRVVPNPATIASGKALIAGDENKISFFNLPVKCTLRIFTETGNLVKTIDHYGTADHEWFQQTDTNQFVTSGIYILAVTDCQDINGNKLDNQFVKFIIVR